MCVAFLTLFTSLTFELSNNANSSAWPLNEATWSDVLPSCKRTNQSNDRLVLLAERLQMELQMPKLFHLLGPARSDDVMKPQIRNYRMWPEPHTYEEGRSSPSILMRKPKIPKYIPTKGASA